MKQLLLVCLFLPFCTACVDDDDSSGSTNCGLPINITNVSDAPFGDNFALSDHTVTGTCLSLTINATGCNDNEWTAELRTDGTIAESLPTQSNARFLFDRHLAADSITCLALASKTFEFDLDPYLGNSLPSRLTVVGPDSTLFTVLVE